MAARSRWTMLGAVAMALIPLAACRDASNAPVSYNVNLGTNDEPLLPTSAPVMTAKVAQGTAEFVAFRDPKAEPEPEGAGGDGAAGGEPVPVDNAKIEKEVRELVREHNEFVMKKDFDAVVEFYVEAQRPRIKSLLVLPKVDEERIQAVRKALDDKLPDEKARIAGVFAKLDDPSSFQITLRSLTVVSPHEVSAKIPSAPPMPDTITFRWLGTGDDANWFIDHSLYADDTMVKMALGITKSIFDMLQAKLADGSFTAEAALKHLEGVARLFEDTNKRMLEQADVEAPDKAEAPAPKAADKPDGATDGDSESKEPSPG